jgi:transcriptional regulator with XRE-family HTH domain
MTDAERKDEQDLPVTAQNLRLLLERSGMTQAELARRAHIARDALGRYVHGVNKPPVKRVMALAEAFGVSHRDIDPSLPEKLHLPRHESVHDEFFSVHPAGKPGHMRIKMDAELPVEAVTAIVEIVGTMVRR